MLRKFIKDSVIYVVPTFLSKGIGLILLPVYTRFLSPDIYGALELLMLLYILLNLTLPLEITQSVARFLADSSELEDKQKIVSTGFWFTLCVFSTATVVILLFPQILSKWLLGDTRFTLEIKVAAIAMLLNSLQYTIQNQLRWLNEAKFSALVSIVFSIFSAITTIFCLAVLNMGLLGVIYGQIIGSVSSLFVGLMLTKKRVAIGWLFDLQLLKKMLKFSAPLVISNIGVYIAIYMDRWLINLFLGLEEVGVYSVAIRIASIVALGTAVFQMSLTPLIYSQYQHNDTPEKIDRILSLVLMISIPLIGLLAIIGGGIIETFIGESYSEASHILGWLSLVILLMSSYVFFPGMWIAEKTKYIAMINITVAIINFIANWFFISWFGIMGAVIGSMIAACVLVVLYFLYSAKEYPIPYRMGRYTSTLIILALFLFVVPSMNNNWIEWGCLGLLAAFVVLVLPHSSDRLWLKNHFYMLYTHEMKK